VPAPPPFAVADSLPSRIVFRPSARSSSFFSEYSFQIALVGVFLAELLYLTFTFDTQILDTVDSGWARFLGWSPQYLRLASTMVAVVVLFSGNALLRGLERLDRQHARTQGRTAYLAVHVIALLAFIQITAAVMSPAFASFKHPGLWTVGWVVLGSVTLGAWALALFPAQTWHQAIARGRRSIVLGMVVGTLVWAVGFLSEQLWTSLAHYTFAVVQWLLSLVYTATVSDPSKLIVGTPTFKVFISPQCSGYEGIGLIVAFLGAYLRAYRDDLEFPGALILLPLGAATIWLVNAVRIVALIVIGTSGWPDIARGGFHSQAGWLAFNAVALSFVALTMRGGYFQRVAPAASKSVVSSAPDLTAAYLGPFVAITATAMLTGAVSAGFDWLYPVRIFAAAAVLWRFRKNYSVLNITWSLPALAVGVITFVVWLALMPAGSTRNVGWPAALSSVPSQRAAAWLFFRVVGYVLITPVVEELAFRGFLTRRLIHAGFENVPLGTFSWFSFLVSSVLFGAFHGGLWFAGTLAGMSFAVALYSRRQLGDAVMAHALTNGLIAVYAFATGQWSVWS
jgi:exosortase E/protease (VPEID-CTERM system)